MSDMIPVPPVIEAIEALDLDTVTPRLFSRSTSRILRAAAARGLFKTLGLKGISVTAPSYSMAQAVHVRLPWLTGEARERYDALEPEFNALWPHDDAREAHPIGQFHKRMYAAEKKTNALLDHAFPTCGDRSDFSSDHFDYCWSVS